MTVANALAWIKLCRTEDKIRQQLKSLPAPLAISDLIRFGADLGFDFSETALCEAFRIDWLMRHVHYGSRQ